MARAVLVAAVAMAAMETMVVAAAMETAAVVAAAIVRGLTLSSRKGVSLP